MHRHSHSTMVCATVCFIRQASARCETALAVSSARFSADFRGLLIKKSHSSTGNPLMRRTPPLEADCLPHEEGVPPASRGLFALCIVITEKRTKIVVSDNDVYEGSCVLSPCTNL